MIEPWKPEFRDRLEKLLTEFLVEMNNDILPTPHNINHLLRSGLQAAKRGEPCLVARNAKRINAFTLWIAAESFLEMRERVLVGIGTYVVPSYRRKGVGTQLRLAANTVAKKAGFDRIEGVAFTRENLHAIEKAGFKAAGVLVRMNLKEA